MKREPFSEYDIELLSEQDFRKFIRDLFIHLNLECKVVKEDGTTPRFEFNNANHS